MKKTRILPPTYLLITILLMIDRQFVRREEWMLADRFGDEWKNYAARTRR